jgi:hypothetical protein
VNKFAIDDELISDIDDALEDQLASESGIPPADIEEADGLADTAIRPDFADLPNRPLRQDEVVFQSGNISVINRAAPGQYVRVYDDQGYPRIVLRELATFALSIRKGDGSRAYTTKPLVAPKEPEYKCRAPGCKKRLVTALDRETHEKAYHSAYAAELASREKRKKEAEQRRRDEILNAALTAVLKKELGEPLVEGLSDDGEISGPPPEDASRKDLLAYAARLFPGRQKEYFRLTRNELWQLCAEGYRALYGEQSEAEGDQEGPIVEEL